MNNETYSPGSVHEYSLHGKSMIHSMDYPCMKHHCEKVWVSVSTMIWIAIWESYEGFHIRKIWAEWLITDNMWFFLKKFYVTLLWTHCILRWHLTSALLNIINFILKQQKWINGFMASSHLSSKLTSLNASAIQHTKTSVLLAAHWWPTV